MASPLLFAAALVLSPPPVDWSYNFLVVDAPAVVGEEASVLGSKALGQLGAKTSRIERSQYGIAAYSTLSFYQAPRLSSRTCEQVVYQAQAVRTRPWTLGLSPTEYLRAQASGDGFRLDYLSIAHRFARADLQGHCADAGPWIWAKDLNTYDAVMYAVEQVRAEKPTAAVSAFLREPIMVVQHANPFMTVEGYTKRLVIELGSSGRVRATRLEDKPPPPLS